MPNGFRPIGRDPKVHTWPLTASQTIAVGDPVYLDSAGRVSIAVENSTAELLGVAASPCTSSTAGDPILVYDDPDQIFEGQCSGNGALADPYTCATLTSCFDIDGTTGIFEIDESTSTQDLIQVCGVGTDPGTGEESAVGTNQRKLFRITEIHHQLRNTA